MVLSSSPASLMILFVGAFVGCINGLVDDDSVQGFLGPFEACPFKDNGLTSTERLNKPLRKAVAATFNLDSENEFQLCPNVENKTANPSAEIEDCGSNSWTVETIEHCALFCEWLNKPHDFYKYKAGLLDEGISQTNFVFGCGGFSISTNSKLTFCSPGVLAIKGKTYDEVVDAESPVKDYVWDSKVDSETGCEENKPTLRLYTEAPTQSPTNVPSRSPSNTPTMHPTSSSPTRQPSTSPPTTAEPSLQPTTGPTPLPTPLPTQFPSSKPTSQPSVSPSGTPTFSPTIVPSLTPTVSFPTNSPTRKPTILPTVSPTAFPSVLSISPSIAPSRAPSASEQAGSATGTSNIDTGTTVIIAVVVFMVITLSIVGIVRFRSHRCKAGGMEGEATSHEHRIVESPKFQEFEIQNVDFVNGHSAHNPENVTPSEIVHQNGSDARYNKGLASPPIANLQHHNHGNEEGDGYNGNTGLVYSKLNHNGAQYAIPADKQRMQPGTEKYHQLHYGQLKAAPSRTTPQPSRSEYDSLDRNPSASPPIANLQHHNHGNEGGGYNGNTGLVYSKLNHNGAQYAIPADKQRMQPGTEKYHQLHYGQLKAAPSHITPQPSRPDYDSLDRNPTRNSMNRALPTNYYATPSDTSNHPTYDYAFDKLNSDPNNSHSSSAGYDTNGTDGDGLHQRQPPPQPNPHHQQAYTNQPTQTNLHKPAYTNQPTQTNLSPGHHGRSEIEDDREYAYVQLDDSLRYNNVQPFDVEQCLDRGYEYAINHTCKVTLRLGSTSPPGLVTPSPPPP